MLIKQVVLPVDTRSTKNKQKIPRNSKLCHVLVTVKKTHTQTIQNKKSSKDMKQTWRKLKIMQHDSKEMWMNSFAFIWRTDPQCPQFLNHCSSEAWVRLGLHLRLFFYDLNLFILIGGLSRFDAGYRMLGAGASMFPKCSSQQSPVSLVC